MPTDRLFTGQRLDSTGPYCYNARYYDPEIWRFISPDTITPGLQNPQAFTRYSYCFYNPPKFNDPTGHWPNWSGTGNAIKANVQIVVNAASENPGKIQTVLDVAGIIPVVGEALDVVNGIIYTAQGDALNAALSFAVCIEVAGNEATGAKLETRGTLCLNNIFVSERILPKPLIHG